jgi:hypothetical protein
MPFGIYGGVINNPGGVYNGQPVQQSIIDLNRKAQSPDPAVRQQAVADFKTISALPQFHGFGWQGLVAMLATMGGGALISSLAGGGSAGAAGATGAASGGSGAATTGGSLAAVQGGLVPEIPLAGIGGGIPNAAAGLGGFSGGGFFGGGAGGFLGLSPTGTQLLNAGIGTLAGAISNSAGARTQVQAPVIAPEFQGLAGLLRQRAMDQLSMPTDTAGLTANAISGINDIYKGIGQSNSNNLTARGLASSPVAGNVDLQTNLARGGQITQFMNNLPLLQRQLASSDIAAGGDVLRFGTGSQTQLPGSALGGALSNLAGQLGYLNQQRLLSQRPQGT